VILRMHAATAVLFLMLAIAHTWPLMTAPATLSRVDNGDYSLNAWALAWVVHQLPRDPRHLFDANIFYPEPRTLAFSEHLMPQAFFAAPVRLSGGSAVLAANLTIVFGLMFTGWAMTWAIAKWTGDWLAGLAAGSILAFNAHTLTRLTHVQALHIEFLPLAFVALDRLLMDRSYAAALRLGGWSALQALTSGYWLVFTGVSVAAACLVRTGEWIRDRVRIGRLVTAGAFGSAILGPFLWPYWQVREVQGLVRSLDEVLMFSARWTDYLTPASRLHLATPLGWFYVSGVSHDTLFPGIVPTALAVSACVTGLAWRDRRARMWLAVGVAGLLLSFGPRTPVYAWLYAHVPLFQGIRAAVRFGFLVIVAIAGLAGFALARLRAPGRPSKLTAALRTAIAIALVAAVNVEALRAPLGWRRFEGISPVYRVLAQMPDAVVAEFPFYRPADFYRNADYMLASTVHWKPIVNGYSGFLPMSYRRLADEMRAFPQASAIAALRRAGVTYVVIHRDRYGEGRDLLIAALDASPDFRQVAGDESVRLYKLVPGR
jgi:hypothetical protein